MKQILKSTLYFFLFIIRSVLRPFFNFKEVVILIYHSVGKNNWSLSVDSEVFDKQMKYLSDKGYTAVSLNDIVAYVRGSKDLPQKTVAITFDDGYLDNYLNAWPILKKYKIPATIFLTTKDDRARGPGCAFPLFYWSEAREMLDSKLIAIESHSESHPNLKELTIGQIRRELRISCQKIKENLGCESRFFAYPGGKFNQKVIDCLKEQGFRAGLTCNEGLIAKGDELFKLKRISVHRSVSFFAFRVRLTKAIDWYAKTIKLLKRLGLLKR